MGNTEEYYQMIISNIEQAVKGNFFPNKEALSIYLQQTRKQGIPESFLSNEKIIELLNTYDEYHKLEETQLDMSNYKSTSLENENYIVSKKDDSILKTEANSEELTDEFKEKQNELSANNKDGLVNADDVYNKMRNTEKEEVTLIPISEILARDNIDTELLNKIKFFITNKYINPYSYKVSPEKGIFYNVETQEILEVRLNPETNEYQIYKGGEAVYKEEKVEEEKDEKNITDQKENVLTNTKVRRLIKPPEIDNRAAFVKVGLLSIVMVVLSIVLSMIIIAIKK